MNAKPILGTVLGAILMILLCSGCSTVPLVDVSVKPTPLPPTNKLPIHALLLLGEDLHVSAYVMNGAARLKYRIGPALEDYARRTAQDCFRDVEEAKSPDEATAHTAAALVLIPHPVNLLRTTGLHGNNNGTLTFVIQWTAQDRVSGNTIWMSTIKAEATEFQGTQFTEKKHERILQQKMFDDLNTKTHQAFADAVELKRAQ